MKNGLGESLELKLCYGCVCHFGETAVKTFLKLVLLVIFLVSVLINSLLFISTASMNILTGWLDKAGLDTPITQMQKVNTTLKKSNARLKSNNAKLVKSNNNIRKKVKKYSNTQSKKIVKRATRKVLNGTAKTAAAVLPGVANVVLVSAVVYDVLELNEMCEDLGEIDSLVSDTSLDAPKTSSMVYEEKVTVCGLEIKKISKDKALSIKTELENLAEKAINDLNKSKNTLSQSFDEKINDWKDWYIQVDGCNVSIGKPICEIVSSPMKLICEKTDNMFYGCAEKN